MSPTIRVGITSWDCGKLDKTLLSWRCAIYPDDAKPNLLLYGWPNPSRPLTSDLRHHNTFQQRRWKPYEHLHMESSFIGCVLKLFSSTKNVNQRQSMKTNSYGSVTWWKILQENEMSQWLHPQPPPLLKRRRNQKNVSNRQTRISLTKKGQEKANPPMNSYMLVCKLVPSAIGMSTIHMDNSGKRIVDLHSWASSINAQPLTDVEPF